MDVPRSTRWMADHPILSFAACVVTLAVLELATGLMSGGFKTWPLFVLGGVVMPIVFIAKARRQTRAARSDD
jgi:hypothetical protein